ncbi:MAG: glucose-6-phosphate isomerase, partial [Opitutaceae bacterium]
MTWDRFKQHHLPFPSLGLALDISRVPFPDGFLASMEAPMQRAFAEMQGLEAGAIANPDEGRMVGHYWLRTPSLAPAAAIAAEITQTVAAIKQFAARVHAGELRAARGTFTRLLVIGIGGSALGPQLVHQALGRPGVDRMQVS